MRSSAGRRGRFSSGASIVHGSDEQSRARAGRATGAPAASRHVILIGMMGVGKTTVGRLLAERLGWDFWDNDAALSKATGKTAAEVQAKDGAPALHAIEDTLLRRALRRSQPTVFAAAASVVLDPPALTGALTVWLRTSPQQEAANLSDSGQHHRPLPTDAAGRLRRMRAVREPEYEELADVMLDPEGDPSATCSKLIEALRERAS